jgi:hypothetical protein
MSEILAATIACPVCGESHENPRCWYEDEDALTGCYVVCPTTRQSFRLTKIVVAAAVVATAEQDQPAFSLDERAETPEAAIDRFTEWLYNLRVHSNLSCVREISQAEGLMNVIYAVYGKSRTAAELLRTLQRELTWQMREVS